MQKTERDGEITSKPRNVEKYSKDRHKKQTQERCIRLKSKKPTENISKKLAKVRK
jgi:hypothetical protein